MIKSNLNAPCRERIHSWTSAAHEAPAGEVIPADSQGDEYKKLLGQVQALVEGGS